MNSLQQGRNFYRFITNAYTAQAQHFRIYDCLSRGYVIMTNGKVIGTTDNFVQAQQFAINYSKKVWCFNCYGVCIARMPIAKIDEYNAKHGIASEKIKSWIEQG